MPGTKRSGVFEHFVVPDDASGTFIAKCKHCNKDFKGSTKATSNLLLHIKVIMTFINMFIFFML